MPAARAGNERLAQCLDGLGFARLEQAERHALGAGLARGQQDLRAADREREGAGRRALHEVSSLDWVHRFLHAASTRHFAHGDCDPRARLWFWEYGCAVAPCLVAS